MARTCSVCAHPERESIDRALVSGESCSALAARYSTVGRMALQRHKDKHIPETLAMAQEAAEVADADGLLDQVKELQRRTLAILDRAEQANDLRTALSAIGQARGNLELLARLLGELQDQQNTVQVLVASPEWLALRSAIMTALTAHPEARQAVLEAISYAGR
jgi:hypothetical protein